MTRRATARLAGIAFLLYIALGIPTMVLQKGAMAGHGVEAKLTSLAHHLGDARLAVLFVLCTSLCALVLGVTLWALTREQDESLAMLALACRVCEGLAGALAVQRTMGLLRLAGPDAPDAATARTLGTWLLAAPGSGVGAILFAVGSLLFAWLLLRGRVVPVPLAWLGVVSSAAAVVVLPLEFVDLFPSRWIWYVWLPLAAYEVPLALWLLMKGAAAPPARSAMAA